MNIARLAVAAAVLIAALPRASSAQDLGVVVNGTALVFDQPPIERDGRVFVPLRGLFERLGASVVFSAGQIAMTAGWHIIGLHVGETAAVIDGQSQLLDAPPIVVGGRTLVPLRFVAQALGAKVAYDGSTRIVTVDGATVASALVAASAVPTATPAAVVPVPTSAPGSLAPLVRGDGPIEIRLLRAEPAPGTTIARKRPELSATFAEAVDPASVRLTIDGRETSAGPLVTSRSFETDPALDLAAGPHVVVVSGRTPDRERFEDRWTFATTDTVNTNFINGLEPVGGTLLTMPTFDVSGFTRPKARVHIVATTNGTSPAFGDASDASQTIDVVASAKGYFEAPLALVDRGSGLVDVRVSSTAPGGDVAVRTLRLRL